jgi:hypothetical protein
LVGSVTRPLKELKGFQKIILRKGRKDSHFWNLCRRFEVL